MKLTIYFDSIKDGKISDMSIALVTKVWGTIEHNNNEKYISISCSNIREIAIAIRSIKKFIKQ